VVKVKGSWVTEDTPAKKFIEYSLSACWENLHVLKSYELTDLFHCISLKAIGKVSYETAFFSSVFNVFQFFPLVSIYITCKIHQNK